MIIELNKIPASGINIDTNIELDKTLYKDADILDLNDLHIKGNINYDYENYLIIQLNVEGVFLVSDSLTLEPIDYSFSCDIEEKIDDIPKYCGDFYQKSKNTLDISEILWENIVLEIPIRATKESSENLIQNGEGWELKNNNEKKIDPRLAKLTELFEERED